MPCFPPFVRFGVTVKMPCFPPFVRFGVTVAFAPEHAAAPLSTPPVDYLPAALLLTFHKSYIPSLQNALCRPGAAF